MLAVHSNVAPMPTTRPIVVPPVPSVAPSFGSMPASAPPAEIVGVTAQPFVGISLDDVIAMALQKTGNLAVSQLGRRIAGYQVVAAKGAYDLRFSVAPTYSYAQNASVSAFQAGPNGAPIKQISIGASGTVSCLSAHGGSYSLGFSGQRVDNNSTVKSYDPYYMTALGITFTQSLVRGRAMNPTRERLELARINRQESDAQALASASTTISSAISTYDDLLGAWRNVAIQEEALRQADAQSHSNQRLVRAGQAAPADVVESDAQVQYYQSEVYAAIQNVAHLQNRLKSMMLTDAQDPIWKANLVPTTLQVQLPPEPKLPDLVVAALRNRPEVALLREQQHSARIALDEAVDESKAQVDLQLGLTSNGFAGNPTNPSANPIFQLFGQEATTINQLVTAANAGLPASNQIAPLPTFNLGVPSSTVGNLGTAIDSMLRDRYPSATATMIIGFPFSNRTGRADVDAARAQQRSLWRSRRRSSFSN